MEHKSVKNRYRAIFLSIADPAFVVDGKMRLMDVNPAFETFAGVSFSDAVGKRCSEVIHNELCCNCPMEKAMAEKSAFANIEADVQIGNETKTVSFSGSFLSDENGKTSGVCMFRDITESKRIKDALERSEARYRGIFDHTKNGVAVYRATDGGNDFTFVDFNQAGQSIEATSKTDVIGKSVRDAFPGVVEFGLFDVFKKVYATGEPEHHPISVYKDDKLMGWRENYVYKLASGEIVAIYSDETERKGQEHELERQAKELARSNKDLEQFAYVASHDLQEPLRMVTSYVQLLARRYKGKLDPDADDFIGFAVDGATRMQELINDLLAYSRVGKSGRRRERVDMNEILKKVLRNLEVSVRETRAEITHSELPVIVADRVQMVQLLQNLIANALKFRKEDESPNIRVAAEIRETQWALSIRDNGIGMEQMYSDRIFTIFQRLHPKNKYSGTGIGLSICKKIVEGHGGRIWAKARPGEGSVFYITIPFDEKEIEESRI